MDHADACTITHVVVAFFVGVNTCLGTWLTLRAKRKDREEASNGK